MDTLWTSLGELEIVAKFHNTYQFNKIAVISQILSVNQMEDVHKLSMYIVCWANWNQESLTGTLN